MTPLIADCLVTLLVTAFVLALVATTAALWHEAPQGGRKDKERK